MYTGRAKRPLSDHRAACPDSITDDSRRPAKQPPSLKPVCKFDAESSAISRDQSGQGCSENSTARLASTKACEERLGQDGPHRFQRPHRIWRKFHRRADRIPAAGMIADRVEGLSALPKKSRIAHRPAAPPEGKIGNSRWLVFLGNAGAYPNSHAKRGTGTFCSADSTKGDSPRRFLDFEQRGTD